MILVFCEVRFTGKYSLAVKSLYVLGKLFTFLFTATGLQLSQGLVLLPFKNGVIKLVKKVTPAKKKQ